MIKVGITGQSGFIGTHLYNFLNLKKDEITIVPFDSDYFENESKLEEFVSKCDVIVHLAAVNRHDVPQIIYDINISLVKRLIIALDKTNSKPHVIFSSSTQETDDNPYGKSKYDGRILFEEWAERTKAEFTRFVIPNVFGPFCKPFYNSVIATFCYQLTHDEKPKIENNANLQLIYVNDLVKLLYYQIASTEPIGVTFHYSKVSEILLMLKDYKKVYFDEHRIPLLDSTFEVNLFNTFRSYISHSFYFPVMLNENTDERGSFVETIRTSIGGQFSYSITLPGVTRGDHYHTRKIERFIVIKGEAVIELRRIGTSDIIFFKLDGDTPAFVDIPIWFAHSITNVSNEKLITLFWANEFYDQDDTDTYFEKVYNEQT